MQTRIFKLSALAALVIAPQAFAEEQLGEVVVQAQSGSTLLENSKAYTTSAMKTTTGLTLSPKETPQSVSVITKAQLDDRGITSMKDALKTTTGVNVVRDSGKYRFQSRGFFINRIEEDGIATTVTGGADGNPYRDSQSMSDLAIYDHIEVVRGATGLTQGVGEPGGTINAVRKKPTSEFQANGNFSFDNFGKARAMTDVSGSFTQSQAVRGRLVSVVESDPTFKDVDNSNRLIYGVVDADLGDSSIMTLGAVYQNRHEQPDYFGVPLDKEGNDLGLSRDTYLGYRWTEFNSRKLNLFAETETFFGENWQWSNRVSYTKNNTTNDIGAITNLSTTYTGFTRGDKLNTNNLLRYDNSGEQLGLKTGLTGKYPLFGRSHDLFVNYTYNYEQGDSRYRRIRNTTAYDPLTFSGAEMARPDWENYTDQVFYNNRIISHGIALGTRFNLLDSLHLLVGSRYTNWRNIGETDYHWWNGKADSDPDTYAVTKRSRFIPYAGLTYDLNENHSLYASYTSIFQPQASKDNENRVLPPILGNNYELGWKSEWFGGKLNTAVALFQINQKNRPISVKNTAGAKPAEYSVPAGEVRSRGLDLEISGNVTDDWQLFAGYTFNKSKYLETESSRYLAGTNFSRHTPKHMFRLYSNYTLPFNEKKWTIGGGVNFQTRTSSLYNVEQASYAIWDANIQYQMNKHITLKVIGNNLTNKRYFENHRTRVRGGNNFYGTPRNFVFSLDWKF